MKSSTRLLDREISDHETQPYLVTKCLNISVVTVWDPTRRGRLTRIGSGQVRPSAERRDPTRPELQTFDAETQSDPRRRSLRFSYDLTERRRRRLCIARSSERSRPTPLQVPAPSGPPTANSFHRVLVVGSSGVGKSTVLSQFFHAAYAGQAPDTPQGRYYVYHCFLTEYM